MMYYDPEKVRAGGPSQFITPPGETWAQLSRRVLSPAVRFRLRLLQADLGNFSLLQHRNRADGFLVTAKHSGSQWLKYMLSVGIAHQHNVPPPQYATGPHADDIIGHPARPRRGPPQQQPEDPVERDELRGGEVVVRLRVAKRDEARGRRDQQPEPRAAQVRPAGDVGDQAVHRVLGRRQDRHHSRRPAQRELEREPGGE